MLCQPTPRPRLLSARERASWREAAAELDLSVRQVKRLLYALKKRGDQAVVQGLRGRPSQRRIAEAVEREAVKILSADV